MFFINNLAPIPGAVIKGNWRSIATSNFPSLIYISDGKLEVAILRQFPLITAPGIGARLFMKNIDKSAYIETYQCESIVLKRKNTDVIHYDGEPVEMGEMLNIKVVHEGLNVIAN